MDVSSQLYALAVLLLAKEPPVPTEEEPEQAPEPVLMLWKEKVILLLPGIEP
jgi:hypothetical protein